MSLLSVWITGSVIRMDNGMTFDKELAHRINTVRQQSGLTKSGLAEQASIPYTTLHRKLTGVGSFTASELSRIVNALGVDYDAIWPPRMDVVA